MKDLPVPSREQIRAYFEGTSYISEEYVESLIMTCHTILVEMRKEQIMRENNPDVLALYEQYRNAINRINWVDNNG
jgi:hypothetical protein